MVEHIFLCWDRGVETLTSLCLLINDFWWYSSTKNICAYVYGMFGETERKFYFFYHPHKEDNEYATRF